MLKDKQFWNEVEDTINEEHSDYAVLDMYFTMRTYRVLTDDELSQLPVPTDKFYYIYNRCRNKAIDMLEYKYAEYIPELESIVKDVPNVRISVTIEHILDFVENNEKPYSLFCAMGVLKGIEDATIDEHTKLLLQLTEHGLLQVIKSL